MYLMYVDESGDSGTTNSPTTHYILSAIVVHESKWAIYLRQLVGFRRHLKKTKGLLMKEEIHASAFISKRLKLKNKVSPSNRLDILRQALELLAKLPFLSVITIRVTKSKHADPFTIAWTALLQRFENTLLHQNFPDPAFKNDCGVIVSDDTDVKKLTGLTRKMRKINYIPNMGGMYVGGSRNMPITFVIKDPVFRASKHSFFLQMVDTVAYFAKQLFVPSKYVKKKGAKNWYGKLLPIINKKATYKSANFKIIDL